MIVEDVFIEVPTIEHMIGRQTDKHTPGSDRRILGYPPEWPKLTLTLWPKKLSSLNRQLFFCFRLHLVCFRRQIGNKFLFARYDKKILSYRYGMGTKSLATQAPSTFWRKKDVEQYNLYGISHMGSSG